jgi:hypothetical protein
MTDASRAFSYTGIRVFGFGENTTPTVMRSTSVAGAVAAGWCVLSGVALARYQPYQRSKSGIDRAS